MKDASFEATKKNIIDDINSCSTKELNKIYQSLKTILKEFDKDSFFKDSKDFFKFFFKDKKSKCLFFIEDICDSRDRLSAEMKEKLRKEFLKVSNIHRTFLENIKALLEAL